MLQVRNGDLDKLGLLFERYNRVLFSFFIRLHSDAMMAEDLVQNVFVRILKYKSGFKGDGQFKVWMFFIARNISNDQFRKNKRSGYHEDIDNWGERLSDFEESEQSDEKKKEDILLKKALESLDSEKRELIVMGKLEGVKYKELASIYGTSEGNIKIKVFRALKELKTAYEMVEKGTNLDFKY